MTKKARKIQQNKQTKIQCLYSEYNARREQNPILPQSLVKQGDMATADGRISPRMAPSTGWHRAAHMVGWGGVSQASACSIVLTLHRLLPQAISSAAQCQSSHDHLQLPSHLQCAGHSWCFRHKPLFQKHFLLLTVGHVKSLGGRRCRPRLCIVGY